MAAIAVVILLLAVGTAVQLQEKAGTRDFETAFVTIVKEAER